MSFSTHVLDAARGCPAGGVPLALRRAGPDETVLASGVTDSDGRFRYTGDQEPESLSAGVYRIVFDTDSYYSGSGQSGFYPEVSVTFRITDPAAHHHVPLLLSPFAYSTYRGS